MSQIPQSKWARGSKLLKLARDVAIKEVGARLPGKPFETAQRLALRIEQTKLLVETLSQMKGAAMKAGQLLSLEGADFLPPEVIQVLSKLQAQGSSLELSEIQRLLKEALGEEVFNQITALSPQPVASASIGQVHTGQWGDHRLAFKVQFPGIAQTIDSDVAMLKGLTEKFYLLTRKEAELAELFEEIRLTLHQETDYLAEMQFMQLYRENFRDFPEYRIPEAYPDLCRPQVLAMEFIEGWPLTQWITQASSEERQVMGERMMQLFLHEYLVCGLVQTDPNWGNFMVDEKQRLVLLDFGACKTYSTEFRTSYREILSHAMNRRRPELIRVSQEFGLLDPRENHEAQEAYLHMMDVVISPFRHVGMFEFSTEEYSQASREATLKFARVLKFSPPPRQLIFLHRKLGGVFQSLKRLETKMDLRLVWEQMMK